MIESGQQHVQQPEFSPSCYCCCSPHSCPPCRRPSSIAQSSSHRRCDELVWLCWARVGREETHPSCGRSIGHFVPFFFFLVRYQDLFLAQRLGDAQCWLAFGVPVQFQHDETYTTKTPLAFTDGFRIGSTVTHRLSVRLSLTQQHGCIHEQQSQQKGGCATQPVQLQYQQCANHASSRVRDGKREARGRLPHTHWSAPFCCTRSTSIQHNEAVSLPACQPASPVQPSHFGTLASPHPFPHFGRKSD